MELDGPHSLSAGPRVLVEKQKSKYRLRYYAERGDDDKLCLPNERGAEASAQRKLTTNWQTVIGTRGTLL